MTNTVEKTQELLEVVENLAVATQAATSEYNEKLSTFDTDELGKELPDLGTALFYLAHEGSQFAEAVKTVRGYLKGELRKAGVETGDSFEEFLRAMMEEMED